MMQAGLYFGVLKVTGLDTVGDKNTPLIALTFTVTHVADNGAWNQLPQGPVERDVRMFLSDAAWPYTEGKLRALGFNGEFGNPDFDEKIKTEGVELKCEIRKDDKGNPRENWDLASWGEKERKPPATDMVRKFTARYKTATTANGKPNGRPPGPPVGSVPTPPNDGSESPPLSDDIPF